MSEGAMYTKRKQFSTAGATRVPFLLKCHAALRLLPLLFTLSCVACFGQIVPTASLEGAVTDPSGANIPSADVSIVNTGTKVGKQMKTDSQGRFGFRFLPPGSYEL